MFEPDNDMYTTLYNKIRRVLQKHLRCNAACVILQEHSNKWFENKEHLDSNFTCWLMIHRYAAEASNESASFMSLSIARMQCFYNNFFVFLVSFSRCIWRTIAFVFCAFVMLCCFTSNIMHEAGYSTATHINDLCSFFSISQVSGKHDVLIHSTF